MFGEVETRSEFIMALEEVALEHCEIDNVASFLWSSSVWTTVEAQRDKVSSSSARLVANVIGVKKPPWMDINQWSPLDREMQRECVDSHQRTSALLGWSRGQNRLLGNFARRPGDVGDFSGDGDSSKGKKWRKTNG